jgi:hypothetical protein
MGPFRFHPETILFSRKSIFPIRVRRDRGPPVGSRLAHLTYGLLRCWSADRVPSGCDSAIAPSPGKQVWDWDWGFVGANGGVGVNGLTKLGCLLRQPA